MEVKYGLPPEVKFCTRCVISNQRPSSTVEHENSPDTPKRTIEFDADGVCSACRVTEKKATIDWAERERELNELCDQHRSMNGKFDCIVPGSGGKDSFYAAHQLIHRFGMHPLLVTWPPNIYTDVGWRNYMRWKELAPHMCYSPAGRTHRLITRLAVERLFHPFQAFVLGQKNLAPRISRMSGIKLCFYGESESEYGSPLAEFAQPERDIGYYTQSGAEMYLGGASVRELMQDFGLGMADLDPYMPAPRGSDTEVHYLGYYLKWKPQECYYYAVQHGQFEPSPERTPGTYSRYNSVDDRLDDFHYWTTYQKFGIGRATYDAAQEIRSGDITRAEGVALVHRYDGEWPARFAQEVNEYLSVPGFEPMTDERWWMLAEKFRSPHLFNDGLLRHKVENA